MFAKTTFARDALIDGYSITKRVLSRDVRISNLSFPPKNLLLTFIAKVLDASIFKKIYPMMNQISAVSKSCLTWRCSTTRDFIVNLLVSNA
jgi:hypothetical protein